MSSNLHQKDQIPELNIARTWKYYTVEEHALWNYNSIQEPICSIVGAYGLAVKTGKIKTLKMQFVDEFQKS